MSLKQYLHNKIEQLLPKLIEQHQHNLQSIDEFMDDFSKRIDNLILETQRKENVDYYTGKVILSLVGRDEMKLSTDLYFKYQDREDYLKQQNSTAPMEMYLFLTENAIAELREQKEVSYPIEKPEVV